MLPKAVLISAPGVAVVRMSAGGAPVSGLPSFGMTNGMREGMKWTTSLEKTKSRVQSKGHAQFLFRTRQEDYEGHKER